MTVSAVLTSETVSKFISHATDVGKIRGTFIWETSDGHAAQTLTFANMDAILEAMTINISAVTDNPTVNITVTDENSGVMITLNTLADGTVHYKDEGDFGRIPVGGDIVLSVDPSADPGGSNQTLTVIVDTKFTRARGGA